MVKKEDSLLKIYTDALKLRISSRCAGSIKEMLFREIDSVHDNIKKLVDEAKKEAKLSKKEEKADGGTTDK